MAKKLGNAAEAYLGTNRISSHTEIRYSPGKRSIVESDAQRAADEPPEQFPGSLGSTNFTITCERDKADTNGQLALITAADAGTSVALKVYPEGKAVGNEEWSCTAYVESVGEVTLKNNALPGYVFALRASGKVTKGTVTA